MVNVILLAKLYRTRVRKQSAYLRRQHVAVDIGWYYFVDRGKINEAIGDLNGDRK